MQYYYELIARLAGQPAVSVGLGPHDQPLPHFSHGTAHLLNPTQSPCACTGGLNGDF